MSCSWSLLIPQLHVRLGRASVSRKLSPETPEQERSLKWQVGYFSLFVLM